ncbi:type I polyketide synthase [Millisia brevis]|uniref:type I polyketide synthase n=1 Tax=Millisia brevis TaxID=264148 RepID=UPI0009FEF346
MTIDDSTSGWRRGVGSAGERINTLAERLRGGESYAVAFGGQGAPWLEPLSELINDGALDGPLTELVAAAQALLAPAKAELLVVRPSGFDPLTWVADHDESFGLEGESVSTPSDAVLSSAAVSIPGVLLTQIAALRALAQQGLDWTSTAPAAIVGHSQGALAVEAARTEGRDDAELLAVAQLIGAAGALVSRRRGLIANSVGSPMVAVSNVDPERLRAILDDLVGTDPGRAELAIRNGRRRVVLSGSPARLARVQEVCEEIADREQREREAKKRGGSVFSPVFEELSVEIGFHHSVLAEAVATVEDWATLCGLDVERAGRLARAVLTDPVDWVAEVDTVIASGAQWVLDLGPSDMMTRLTGALLRGRGVGVVAAATRQGQRSLFTPGAVREPDPKWSDFAPTTVRLPDGRVVVETSFTRLTGRSPMLLAGMTPTTVDAGIVAAAANAGHWAELAGGGQVTEEIFLDRVKHLRSLLEPGRRVQFNSLFLDPYLWKLQLGGRRLVQRARAAGAPFDGVVVTAGIPELEEAVELIAELTEVGITHVAFKPGTVAQIKAVLRIAAEVPDYPVIVHIEGGRAGGHHSWEDLDDLLLATYADLRTRPNVIVCVGGGIGTADRAADYITGEWSVQLGYPAMPLDGVLVGTAAMATLEATTSPEVKQLLVDTPGTPDWVGAGTATGGMASGRSQLGADIHEIDNAASRTGRLLDDVAGDDEAVAARRDEIIAALDGTAKPYFGDVETMTYGDWLGRYVDLAIGADVAAPFDTGSAVADAALVGGRSVWLDVSWRNRFREMLERTEARLNEADRGTIASLFADDALESPRDAIAALIARYPEAASTVLHPVDVPFFIALCRTPGKPVNFVPVIDKDVRRWWRSDSLWQAHDPRYGADEVCVIPGTVAVAGITRVDEPVGELLDRFEAAAAERITAAGGEPVDVDSRRRGDAADGPLATLLLSPDVSWAGRITINPIHKLGDVDAWSIDGDTGVHPPTGARLSLVEDGLVRLSVPLGDSRTVTIPIRMPAAVATGAAPVVEYADAEAAMSELLTLAAGQDLATVRNGVARINIAWQPDLPADHTGVTAAGLAGSLTGGPHGVPDVLVGACWPAVFAVLGAAHTADGDAVIEGMLDLVHLDHAIQLFAELPDEVAVLAVKATSGDVVDTDIGRVVEVRVEIGLMLDQGIETPVLAVLRERFAIRGRTGEAELPDPDRAGGSLTDAVSDTPRRRRRDTTITAPRSMASFAQVSGDHNPIHTSNAAARLAGLGSPIVHGMWLSAAAQQVVVAIDAEQALPPRRLTAWTARFLGMVRPGAPIDVRVDRIARDGGAEIVEVSCRIGSDLVMVATGRIAAPKTVYAFPGQGIQKPGMGLDARARSAAARQIWERADKHTRKALGFSILAVVRDNPTEVKARGVTYRHPAGVLHLTQFTQVAMATLGVAQIAELRESGAFVEDAILCGHSVGEYNALAAVAGVLPLEAILEVVFQRGSAMHELVPRHEDGTSDYRMAAIRPSQMGLPDAQVEEFIAQIASDTGEFLQVVNLNLRGSQYAIAGTVAGLEELEKRADKMRLDFGGKRSFILVPGIDVPFHSSVLRRGVPDFRARLEQLLPEEIDPSILLGRYIPNLVPKPFSLERDFVQEIADLVPSDPLATVLADWDNWAAQPAKLTRVVLTELLAWQFASPVRWIETQDLLFASEADGGMGVERFIEVGLASAPTVAGLATNTLKLPGRVGYPVEVLNIEREAAVVYSTDVDPAPVEDEPEPSVPVENDSAAAEAARGAAVAAAPAPAPAPAAAPAGGPAPADIGFAAADATKILIGLWTKMRVDQIGPADTIEALCDGVSSRRNQLLVDLGSELGLGAIDGAADADLVSLAGTVDKLARTYRPFGPVLTDSIGDHLRKVFGPTGKRPSYVQDRVTGVWQLGPGWASHVTAEVALGTREGDSVRGGPLGGLVESLTDTASVDAAIDAAVAGVAARRGVSVALPSAGGGGGGTVDAAALGEFTDQITGKDGVLASAARLVLEQLGLAERISDAGVDTTDQELVDLVAAELGSDWPRTVASAFDDKRAVLLDDRWASAREDLARIWIDSEVDVLSAAFVGAGDAVAEQAGWWAARATAAGRPDLVEKYERIAAAAQDTTPGQFADEVAVVTGAGKGSIAAATIEKLLSGGATVFATTSRLDASRLAMYRDLYRRSARSGAALWVVPANMASYTDVDALIEWVGSEQTVTAGGSAVVVKQAFTPTLLLPFAAPRVSGELADAGARAEMEMRVLLWSVERLIAGLAAVGVDSDVDGRLHVILPGSPNRGIFGGDGAYGESKAAFDAVLNRWKVERNWAERVTLAHARIGWVRGTGLMGHNDPMVDAVEAAGVSTWSTSEMADQLLAAASPEARERAADGPIDIDLTGGLADLEISLPELARQAAESAEAEADAEAPEQAAPAGVHALPAPPGVGIESSIPTWPTIDARPEDLVVVVGAGELGPYGSARTRFEMEVDEKLSAAGVLELAWVTGLITWENDPKPGWYDAESGDLVPEYEIAERYHDTVVERSGIRRYGDDDEMIDNTAPLMTSIFLDNDLTFSAGSEAEARAYASSDPERTVIFEDDGEWKVTRKAGSEIRVPRRMKLTRTVGGQIPTGFDVTRWGISPDMASSVDRVALWNIVCTVDAFLSSGFTPAELMRWIHPGLVANTQGTGMGGMTSMRSLYIDTLLGESRANDILQEALPNVVAAHVVQSYVGSYGAMVHPVAACATAAVSVEEGVDKIRLGKAGFVVAGGFDDLSIEGIIGFGDMSATADSKAMSAKGIEDRRFSRANDRRRGGFVESHGGGTILLARGDLALEMGLPVLGVIGWAQSFGDGVHTSIPAPGLGALGAGIGGGSSPMATSLARLGVGPDDIAVVSKHDTSTAANDPNEAELHTRLARKLGRSAGNPLFVISQKSLTGHSKGGAAAFQLIGLCQVLAAGVIPPNRSLDCVDEQMADFPNLVWAREPLRFGENLPLRAGLLTSLGFGHVSGLIAVVHPEAFVASIPEERRAAYRAAAHQRRVDGARRLVAAMAGGPELYQRPPSDRRLGPDDSAHKKAKAFEAEMLMDSSARLGDDSVYRIVGTNGAVADSVSGGGSGAGGAQEAEGRA